VHLFGQLGELPPLSSDGLGIPYDSPVAVEHLGKAASGIKIIHEATDKEPFKQAHELLRNATRVCFLGFGYDQTNMQRLLGYDHGLLPDVYGSAMGLTDRECELIRSGLQSRGFHRVIRIDGIFGDSLKFLHDNCPFD
jgi:hypothetical protein